MQINEIIENFNRDIDQLFEDTDNLKSSYEVLKRRKPRLENKNYETTKTEKS